MKRTRREGETWGTVVDTVPLAVDYFDAARASLKEAAASDLFYDVRRDPELPSALYEATSYLYSTLKHKARMSDFHPVGMFAALKLVVVMAAILLALHFVAGLLGRDSLLAALLVIVEFIGAGVTLLMAYGMFRSASDDAELAAKYRKQDATIAQNIGRYHADARKLLCYYQLWRQDVARRVDAGYKIQGYEGKDMLPDCLANMDAVIVELESVVSRTATFC